MRDLITLKHNVTKLYFTSLYTQAYHIFIVCIVQRRDVVVL